MADPISSAALDALTSLAAELRELSVGIEAFVAGDSDAFTGDDALAGHHALAIAAMQAGTIRRMREGQQREQTYVRLRGL